LNRKEIEVSGPNIHKGTGGRHCYPSPDDEVVRVSGAQIDTLIAVYDRLAPWHTPLFRAARDGILMLMICPRGIAVKQRVLRELPQPAVILVNDDDERSSGPDAFPYVGRVLKWARAAFLHCAAGEAAHYEAVVRLTVKHQRLLLIESSHTYADAWRSLSAGKIIGGVLTRPGVAHPVARPQGTLQ
jgi:hypothetical protein